MKTFTFVILQVVLVSAAMAGETASDYAKHCAGCHDPSDSVRAPSLESLRSLTAERVYAALTRGSMRDHASQLSDAAKREVAEYASGKQLGSDAATKRQAGRCPRSDPFVDPSSQPRWMAWGNDLSNARFQPAASAGLVLQDVPKLRLKWAFGVSGVLRMAAQPVVVGGRLFMGAENGELYALDARTGCTYWTYETGKGIRAAVSVGPASPSATGRWLVYVADLSATVHAIDASTGELVWKTKVEQFPAGRVTGSPVLFENRLYVPVASNEEMAAIDAKYECCRFRGSVVALNAGTGQTIWKSYTIATEPAPTRRNKVDVQMWAPAGAAVWSAPTIDPQRGLLYIGTGNAYNEPDTETTDAILALSLDNGKIAWVRQMTSKDWYTISCRMPGRENCPETVGPDFDFGSSPILRTLKSGKAILVVGQKSGMVFGLDPDRQGAVVWQQRLGTGGRLGGVQWGMAADDANVYVPISDVTSPGPAGSGSISAVDLASGRVLWTVASLMPDCTGRKAEALNLIGFGIAGCSGAMSAVATVIPGALFAGSIDGHVRAFAAADGKMLWDVDTARGYETVNGVEAVGGSLDGPGPAVVDGMVYVTSGYGIFQGMPGNVLLAFSVDGK